VEAENNSEYLFALPAATLQERISARRDSVMDRVKEVANIVNKTPGPWVIWCNLNSESDAVTKAIEGSIEVKGSDSPEKKTERLNGFSNGKFRVMVTKPTIAGFGLNWQHCANVAFLGISDSYEQFYQAVRRCWRFGQKSPVNCHIVISRAEGAVLDNIKRKEKDAERMAMEMVKNMSDIETANIRGNGESKKYYKEIKESTDWWTLYFGDSVEVLSKRPSNIFHYSIFSPPFASLYTYTDSDRDMGNCKSQGEFLRHLEFLVEQLYRTIMPGRLLSFHCMNLPTSKQNHGYIGIRDFRGDLIRLFEKVGFIFHSEVCIWKDPVTAMQRTKALGLLHKQLKKDACMSRQGIPDYLVTMRKPGQNLEPVKNTNDTFPVQVWQNYASPVWMDINPSKTLQYRSAREHKDERHICPLQLEVIERALKLWTNEGDTVLSPFAGIGSEGWTALQMGRKFTGIELKQSYFEQAKRNLLDAQKSCESGVLFKDAM
jgi:DNA modification methylase